MKQTKPKYMQIIDAAVIVIAENGYHQAQVSKIAKQAGVADGTIYLYFKNKEDILVSMFREKMGEFIEKIEAEIKSETTASNKLYALIKTHFSLLAADHHMAIVTQLELRQSNKELRLRINEVLKGYFNVIDHIIKTGMDSGEFNPIINHRIARQMIFGTIDEVVTTWVMNEQKYELEKQVDPVHALIVNGFANKNK
ncbi:TetR/AcrR family transcriptional regulator [Metabacillus malikii]|uniref:TetR/AcrR family fatty acid metabolism transcriptional regulator n=1 Tax=Metabacillus malikii TaxID=1504265 RepID=A0ABT9ZGQ1_9BACI|nr:TetR/AcrR family transcriptional regulator [Metabacillus malikii]MDQ0230977.1 TetR/AcrR family fatty acid metabolism transcriptional regulator [Metabacillus malikii]